MNPKSKPKVRFLGFKEEWVERRLGDNAEILTGGTPNTKVKEYWGPKEIPWMSSGEVNKKRLTSTDNYISKYGLENSSARWIEKLSVLIALAGQGKTRGTVAINELPLTTNQSIAAITPKSELYHEFIFQNLEMRYEELRLMSSGDGSRGGLNKRIISDVKISSPSKDEQFMIGDFFKQLDDTISLYQQELDTLKQTKKAFLQKMFPNEGESLPELRFPGFSQKWNQKKLGDISSVSMCKRIFKHQTTESGEIPFFKIGTFGRTPNSYISRELFEEFRNKYPFPEIGDVLISASGTIGRTVVYNGDEAYYQDSNIVWLKRNKELVENSFLQQFFQFVKWAGTEGSTIKRLYNNNILRTEISLPSIKEQLEIGNFFKNLDRVISIQQQELDALKQTKKAFLQKMFV